jgi:hypothetical protein
MSNQGRGGGSPFNDMIQNFMMLNQVKAQRDQLAHQKRQQMVEGLTSYMDQARTMPDPDSLSNLKQFYSQTLGIAPETLDELSASILPNIETQRTGAVRRGMAGMSPEQAGQLDLTAATTAIGGQTPAQMGTDQFLLDTLQGPETNMLSQALRSRLAAGLSPGELKMSATLAGMPEDFFRTRHMVEGGQLLSSGQTAQMELGWADHRQRERFHTAEMALRETGLELDARAMDAKIQAGQGEEILKEIEEYGKALRSLSETQASRTQQEITAAEGAVNLMAQRLVDQGVLPPEWWQLPDGRLVQAKYYDPAKARADGWKPIGPRIDETARKNIFERRWR